MADPARSVRPRAAADRLQPGERAVLDEYADLEARLADPAVHRDFLLARRLRRSQIALRPLRDDVFRLRALLDDLRDARDLAADTPEWASEAEHLERQATALRTSIAEALTSRDRYDQYDVVIRLAPEGEATADGSRFVGAMLTHYRARARALGWRTDLLCEVTASVALAVTAGQDGQGAWAVLKAENGLHRVVARDGPAEGIVRVTVLPDARPRRVAMEDIRIDLSCTRPPAAQSYVRVTHEPTGIMAVARAPRSAGDRAGMLRVLFAELAAGEMGPDEPAARYLRHPAEPVARH